MEAAKAKLFQSTLPTRGSDYKRRDCYNRRRYISIHAPHEGERQRYLICTIVSTKFQSTLPTRGSDGQRQMISVQQAENFNPRSPRGGATRDSTDQPVSRYISIHAPHEGERPLLLPSMSIMSIFQSTLPTRGSDGIAWAEIFANPISIHAPHEGERRWATAKPPTSRAHFNPRSPRGGATHGGHEMG